MNSSSTPPCISRRAFVLTAAATGVVLSVRPIASFAAPAAGTPAFPTALDPGFASPPDEFKPWAYWFWLNSAATMEGITRDLEELKQQGISGVLLLDLGESGAAAASPQGSFFMSGEWRAHFQHAVREAARLGLEVSVNLCSGYDAGGPWVTREDAIKHFVWKETVVEGPRHLDVPLERYVEPPPFNPSLASFGITAQIEAIDWYRDVAVLACREGENSLWQLGEIQDLTSALDNGRLRWQVPPGKWTILRMGYVVRKFDRSSFYQVKNASHPQESWEIDPMSAEAMDRHWAETGAKLVKDAGALTGTTFKYTHIDSWEIGVPTWTGEFIDEFRARRGYDPTRYLPVLAKKVLDTPDTTERFRWDYRRTIADLIAENYYGRVSTLSRESGLGTDSESGGPFYFQPIDPLECEGTNAVPMAEFWAIPWVHEAKGKFLTPEEQHARGIFEGVSTAFFQSGASSYSESAYGSIKQAANAAHLYGKGVTHGEAFTSFNDDWSEDPYFLKSFGDRAFCLGLTRNVLHHVVHQSTLNEIPGYEWEHVGTHFDRNITWWSKSHAWLTYLARCQYLLRQGVFVADMLYFAGEAIPNFVVRNHKPVKGFDYDAINAQALLTHTDVKDGRITVPSGTSYRYLVLPEGAADRVTPDVLSKMQELVEAGATLIGQRPKHSLGLVDYPRSEERVKAITEKLWGPNESPSGIRTLGKGRVIWGSKLEAVTQDDRLEPDVELRGVSEAVDLDWIHRAAGASDIYFIANLTELPASAEVVFRVTGRVPELWDPVTGEIRELPEWKPEDARVAVPLEFAPKQSWFVVFRKAAHKSAVRKAVNFPTLTELLALSGPWDVSFDEQWGGPANVVFEQLQDWSQRPEDGIRYYSGTAIYRKTFDAPVNRGNPLYLDLGEVKNLAQVRLNGKDLGIVWTAPWRVALRESLKSRGNRLEIEVVNLWPNRLIGDGKLPAGERRTKTNVRTYEPKLPADFICWGNPACEDRKKTGAPPQLLKSGLLGPVRVMLEG